MRRMADNRYECPNCGNLMKPNESSCRYCGSGNPSYKSIWVDNFFNGFTSSQPKSQNATSSESKSGGASNVNWLLAIILLICCWPIGLIYIVLKMSSK